jgi:hypothetical protein
VSAKFNSLAMNANFDGTSELYLAYGNPRTGELTTRVYAEHRPDLGEISPPDDVNWEVALPAGATLMLPAGGLKRNTLMNFWVVWAEKNKYSLMSVLESKPVLIPFQENEAPIFPMVMLPDSKLHAFTWVGNKLACHEAKTSKLLPVKFSRTDLGTSLSPPLLSVASPVAASRDEEAALAWIEESDKGAVVVLATVVRSKLTPWRLPPIKDYRVFAHQRPSLMSHKRGNLDFRAVLERADGKGYAIVTATCRGTLESCTATTEPIEGVGSGALVSAASFHKKGWPSALHGDQEIIARTFLLDKDRNLWRGNSKARTDVPPTYDFPLMTGAEVVYEAVPGKDGNPILRHF